MSTALVLVMAMSFCVLLSLIGGGVYWYYQSKNTLLNQYVNKDGEIMDIEVLPEGKTYTDVVRFHLDVASIPISEKMDRSIYLINTKYSTKDKWNSLMDKEIITEESDTPFTLEIKLYGNIEGNNGTVSCDTYCSGTWGKDQLGWETLKCANTPKSKDLCSKVGYTNPNDNTCVCEKV